MLDLSQLTFIIPVKIESRDRYQNLKTVLGYINHHFMTNVYLFEAHHGETRIDFLETLNNLNIKYFSEVIDKSEPFHRTKYLNNMLNNVNTRLVSNYDADVLLPVQVYKKVCDQLLDTDVDFIYPYGHGLFQKQLFYSKWYEDKQKDLLYYSMLRFLETWNLSYLDYEDTFLKINESSYGHCFFAKTQSYKDAFGENEYFISYGPEDSERYKRFSKLGFNVERYDSYVYHLEHERTVDSNISNPFFTRNNCLYLFLNELNRNELIKFYEKIFFSEFLQ